MEASQSDTEKFKQFFERYLESIYPSPDLSTTFTTGSRKPTKPALQGGQKIELNAKPIEERNETKTNAFDGRTQILKTAQWPNSVHGVLVFKVQNVTTWGTGILIGPHIVLTAGHVLYDHDTQAFTDIKTLQFLPGMNGQVLPFGAIEVEQYFVSPNYVQEKREDYGILVLKKPIGEVTGYFGLACLEPKEIRSKRINVTGYPGDKVASKPNMYEMWGMEGEVAHIDETQGVISYLIDTDTGQSGSGIWFKKGEDYHVCGVHVSGNKFVNTATLLTRAMYKQIYTWLQQVSFKELLFKSRCSILMFGMCDADINTECLSILTKYNLENIVELDLSFQNLRSEEVKVLVKNTSWVNLSSLNLFCNHIDEEGAKAIAQNRTWTKLKWLILSENNIGTEGAKVIAQNNFWTDLSNLILDDNNIGTEGAIAIAQNTSWHLSRLNLSRNNIGEEGIKAIAQNPSWKGLETLVLCGNNIDAKGAKALAQNNSWTYLSRLYLSDNNIGKEGAVALAQNTSWKKLSELYLLNSHVCEEGWNALEENETWNKDIMFWA